MSESIEAFTFGDPIPVMDGTDFLGYMECLRTAKWYEPPIPWDAIARSYRAAVHHSSAIQAIRNMLLATIIPHPLLPMTELVKFILDWLVFGNGYLLMTRNRIGELLQIRAPLAKYVRRGTDLERYFYIPEYLVDTEFPMGSIFHLLQPDIHQDIYGLPDYLAALSSAWLNESATLFRRKYYKNGSHAGFIMYMTDPAQNQKDVDSLREALKNSKGPGNFRNLFMYAPNGKKDGIQIIPIAEVMAKDEFLNIKLTTRDDQLASFRIPPQLMGIVPANTGGFGDVEKAARVFFANELQPMQVRMQEINVWAGEEIIKFRPYILPSEPGQPLM